MGKIEFEQFELDNGLRVIVHTDVSTPLACLDIMYDVGSKDEEPDRTGFAHLFEHLMFGGSVNIPTYDTPLQLVGGSNNAYTSSDVTNYYITLPAQNLETAFWLESDRMLDLAFTPKSLEVQRNVVIEEFKERYLNRPYGDAWLLMRPLAFKVHPYQWATIGKEIRHIEEASMDEVKAFYKKHYRPSNAIMVVAGNVSTEEVRRLTEKWFAPIQKGKKPQRKLPLEPQQTEARRLVVERDVPLDAIYVSFHMCGKTDADYPAWNLLSDVLGGIESSRLHQRLVKEKRIFSSIIAFVGGDIDPGLFTVAGHVSQDRSIEEAEAAIWEEIEVLRNNLPEQMEMQKVKNQIEAEFEFNNMELLNRAQGLAFHQLMGDAARINTEIERYQAVRAEDLQRLAQHHLVATNSSTLVYKRSN